MNKVMGPGGVEIVTMTPIKNIATAKQVWKGPPKIGKTSTAAALATVAKKYNLPVKPFFLLFEAGAGGVELEGTSIKCPVCKGTGKEGKKRCSECDGVGSVRHCLQTRKEMREWFEWVVKTDYNPIVIDTGDAMYQAIMDDTCVELNISSPFGANDNGISWAMIYDEFRELLAILTGGGKGVILIQHVTMQEKRVRGGSVMQAVFNLPGKARSLVSGWADQILHFDVAPGGDKEKDKRILIAEQQASVEAGDRWGLFPPESDLGNSPEESAEVILECFGYLEKEK